MSTQVEERAREAVTVGRGKRNNGNLSGGIESYREAVGLYRQLGDELKLAHTVRHVGDMLREQGSVEEARLCYQEADSLYRKHPEANHLDVANALRGYALLSEAAGERDEAKALWREAREFYASAEVEAGVKEAEKRLE